MNTRLLLVIRHIRFRCSQVVRKGTGRRAQKQVPATMSSRRAWSSNDPRPGAPQSISA